MDEPWMFYCHLVDLKDPTIWAKDFEDKKFGESIYDRNLSALDIWIGKFLESIDLTKCRVCIFKWFRIYYFF